MIQIASLLRPAAVAFAIGALAVAAQAQTKPAAKPASASSGPVERAVDATKDTAKKVGSATASGARKAASAVRHTGEKIGEKVPAGSPDGKTDKQGAAKEKTKP